MECSREYIKYSNTDGRQLVVIHV